MQSLKPTRWSGFEPARPAQSAARRLASAGFARASAALAQLALRLAQPVALAARHDPQYEFHADAGAPEGALYLDGKLVGWVTGVTRL